MSKYAEVAQLLQREAKRYEALNSAAAALNELGSIEQAAAEQQSAASAAKEAADRARAELANLVEEIEQYKVNLAKRRQDGDDTIAKANAMANAQATAILQMAEQQAAQIKERAASEAAKMVNETNQSISAANTEYAGLVAEISGLKDSARTTEAEAQAAEKRLAKVKESIARLAGVDA